MINPGILFRSVNWNDLTLQLTLVILGGIIILNYDKLTDLYSPPWAQEFLAGAPYPSLGAP